MGFKKINYSRTSNLKFCKNLLHHEFLQQTAVRKKYYELEECPDIMYAIVVHHDPEDDQIVIYLKIVMKNPTIINAKFKIFIPSVNFFEEMQRIFSNSGNCGQGICSVKEFFDPANKFFVNDELRFQIEVNLNFEIEEQICAEIVYSNNLGQLLWDRDDKDFDINVGGKIVKIHKCVIGSKSPVFNRMFQSGFKEAKENKVVITDFNFEIVEAAMKFCYCIKINEFLTITNCCNLLQFSDKYDIEDLKNSMEIHLFNKKSTMNVCQIINASIISNSQKLFDQCFNYLVEKNKTIFIADLYILDSNVALNLSKAA